MQIIHLCLILILWFGSASSHLTCHLSEEVDVSGSSSVAEASKVIVGPPGKQGPRGPPGDLQNCNCTDYSGILQRVKEMEETISHLKKSAACKGVVYEDTCIRLLKTVYDPVNYVASSDQCSFHGGRLADIPTDQLFHQVYDYIKQEWNVYKSHNLIYVHVRLGMKYMNGAFVTSSGRSIDPNTVGFWHAGCPRAGYVYMGLVVSMDQSKVTDGSHGFHNNAADHGDLVPLCQFPL